MPSFVAASDIAHYVSFQKNIGGSDIPDRKHDYPTAEVGLYNLLRTAFAPN